MVYSGQYCLFSKWVTHLSSFFYSTHLHKNMTLFFCPTYISITYYNPYVYDQCWTVDSHNVTNIDNQGISAKKCQINRISHELKQQTFSSTLISQKYELLVEGQHFKVINVQLLFKVPLKCSYLMHDNNGVGKGGKEGASASFILKSGALVPTFVLESTVLAPPLNKGSV